MLKKLATIGVTTSIMFAPLVFAPTAALAQAAPRPDAPAVDAPDPAHGSPPQIKHEPHKVLVDAAPPQPKATKKAATKKTATKKTATKKAK